MDVRSRELNQSGPRWHWPNFKGTGTEEHWPLFIAWLIIILNYYYIQFSRNLSNTVSSSLQYPIKINWKIKEEALYNIHMKILHVQSTWYLYIFDRQMIILPWASVKVLDFLLQSFQVLLLLPKENISDVVNVVCLLLNI